MPDEHGTSAAETAPLLGQRRRPSHRRFPSVASITTSIHIPQAHNKTTILRLLNIITLLAGSATGFLSLPQAQVIEYAVCHEYYDKLQSLPNTPIDEELCKADAISAELAFVLAITSALTAGVGLVATFPWSVVADRYGRKPVLSICFAGVTLSGLWSTMILWLGLPVRLVWLESLGQLIGGGNPIALGLMFCMITDTTNEEERAVVFMRLHVASLAGNMLAPTLSSLLMEHYGPWLPMWIGNGSIASAAILVLFIPETMHVKTAAAAAPTQTETETQVPGQPTSSRLARVLARLKESLTLSSSPSLILLLATCLVGMPAAFSTSVFMPVFLSTRYGTKLLQGGYVQSAFGCAQMLMLFGVMPWISQLARGVTADEHHRDIVIARWSAVAMLLAAVVLGLAPSVAAFMFGLAVLALGSGTFSLIRSLMSLYVEPKRRSRLFGLVGMVEIVGQMYAQPMLAELFALGLRLGGAWIGLPYLGLAVLMAVVTGFLMFVRVTGAHKAKDPESPRSLGD